MPSIYISLSDFQDRKLKTLIAKYTMYITTCGTFTYVRKEIPIHMRLLMPHRIKAPLLFMPTNTLPAMDNTIATKETTPIINVYPTFQPLHQHQEDTLALPQTRPIDEGVS